MPLYCNTCNATLDAGYEWIGLSVTCPLCLASTVLRPRPGQGVVSEYELTYDQFISLLTVDSWRQEARPFVGRILGCSVKSRGEGFVLEMSDGAVMPPEVAHLRIQGNAESQRDLYGLAMGMWR